MSGAESEALRTCSANLVRLVQDTDQLAWELYSDGIISNYVRESVTAEALLADKNTKLFSAVGNQIDVDPAKFPNLLRALRRRPHLKVVVDKLETTHGML